MDFQSKFNGYINAINTHLFDIFDKKEGSTYEAMRYSLYAGGKRVRPVLTLACCEALGGNLDAALCYGSSIEMIHTYSLIHDDLPCMDNDELRRGKPTNHIVFGENMAVLSGDALLNFACENIVNSKVGTHDMNLNALRILFTASGADGMIGGQVLDLAAEDKIISAEELTVLHKKKTGALIVASAALGAVSAERDENLFSAYASSLGLAFQICDDILDVESDTETFGKPIHSDEKNKKTTYITLYGVDGARAKLHEETEKAIASLDFLGKDGAFLKDFALYLLGRKN